MKVLNPKAAKRPKCFLSSSDGLAQYCVNFSRWFMHKTAAFYTEQCTTPLLFHNFEVSQGVRSHSLKKLWLPVWDAIFFIYMCTFQPSNNSKLITQDR